jgi:hypothetical protein
MKTVNDTTSSSLSLDQTVNISREEVIESLNAWGKGLVAIANAYATKQDYTKLASDIINKAYDYNNQPVLFKPTLTSKSMFRTTFEGALSYFVGGNSKFSEDSGFALSPWAEANFDLAGVMTEGSIGTTMGNKLLTKKDGTRVIANFTMVFKKYAPGDIRIVLHHSSLPYNPA